MLSAPLNTTTPSLFSSSFGFSFVNSFERHDFSPKRTGMRFIDTNQRKSTFTRFKCIHDHKSGCALKPSARNPSFSCITATEAHLAPSSELVVDKLHRVVTEFRSLEEPIDRVKRLLHYAAVLPPADESKTRAPENRVTGCTTQVWVEAELDESGRVRFRADSDSEISKGFCSCLIYVMDGADPEEVAMVKAEDLSDLNVGLHGKSHSRVNTWHNVLIAMQKRTKALLAQAQVIN
jgi:quinolinate synthase|uniref:Fe-S metabolism associated domain-containing protein n=1 Tax=Fagus sylvatica TaxID=28930 RepID=A0A2N9HXA5_FAGSY